MLPSKEELSNINVFNQWVKYSHQLNHILKEFSKKDDDIVYFEVLEEFRNRHYWYSCLRKDINLVENLELTSANFSIGDIGIEQSKLDKIMDKYDSNTDHFVEDFISTEQLQHFINCEICIDGDQFENGSGFCCQKFSS